MSEITNVFEKRMKHKTVTKLGITRLPKTKELRTTVRSFQNRKAETTDNKIKTMQLVPD